MLLALHRRAARLVAAIVVALLVLLVATPATAHPGGLDSSGCHNNRKTGEYHCHRATTKTAPARKTTKAPNKRSASAKAAFRRDNPCPSTGSTTGPCPGNEIDHKKPLACGGADTPSNMQWLTKEENRKKGAMGCRRR